MQWTPSVIKPLSVLTDASYVIDVQNAKVIIVKCIFSIIAHRSLNREKYYLSCYV